MAYQRVAYGLAPETVVVAGTEQVSVDFGDEVVVLNVEQGMYYTLPKVGGVVWQLIQEPITVNDLCEAVMARYEVDRERCFEDLQHLIEDLWAAGLIEFHDAAHPSSP